jgi:uridine kinase
VNHANLAEVTTLVIGLAGGTGSGKTTVSEAVRRAAGPERVLILPQDAYYRAQSELPFAVRERTNYDEPSAFDTPLLIEQLDALLRGEAVARPVYDFARHDRAEATVRVTPRPVIVVEGILVLHDPALRERLTLRVFVDAPPDERFIRRLERDVRERGRSAQSVIEQYRRSVKPMHDLFVEPTKAHADLIIPEGGNNRVALEVLSTFVASFTERYAGRPEERA